MIKKSYFIVGLVTIVLLLNVSLQILPGESNPNFIQSYWAVDTTHSTKNDDWDDASTTAITTTNHEVSGNIYVKNDQYYLFIGIELITEIIEENYRESSSSLVLNLDSNNDRLWADDCKVIFTSSYNRVEDGHYYIGEKNYTADSGIKGFEGKYENIDDSSVFFSFKISLTSDNVLENLQIPQVDGSAIGISFDFYYNRIISHTLAGQPYPNYANASNYTTIVLADSSEIAAPDFGTKPANTTTTTDKTYDYTRGEAGMAAPGFSALSLFGSLLLLSAIYRYVTARRKKINKENR